MIIHLRIIIILALLLALLPWTPALAHEPGADPEPSAVPAPAAEPAEPEPERAAPFSVPEGYAARTLAVTLSVTVVDTPSSTSGIVDALVVMDVARQLSARGEAGLVVACVRARDNPAVCGITALALTEGVAEVRPVGGRMARIK